LLRRSSGLRDLEPVSNTLADRLAQTSIRLTISRLFARQIARAQQAPVEEIDRADATVEDRLRSTVSALREQVIDLESGVGVQAPADDDRMVA